MLLKPEERRKPFLGMPELPAPPIIESIPDAVVRFGGKNSHRSRSGIGPHARQSTAVYKTAPRASETPSSNHSTESPFTEAILSEFVLIPN